MREADHPGRPIASSGLWALAGTLRHLSVRAYEDAYAFLAKLKHAQTLLSGGLEPPGEKAQLEAREGRVAEVGLHDNHYDPKTLTVDKGAFLKDLIGAPAGTANAPVAEIKIGG